MVRSVPSASDLDEAAATFSELRPRLFGIAYRMLGSVADADDVVQDAWIRWQEYDRSAVREPAAFLATTTTRLAINELQCARVRREGYVGPWVSEPIDTRDDPELAAERDEALESAVLLLLERLSPTERAAYVLREAFAYPYERIAEIVQTTAANARQLVSRARRHLAEGRHATVRSDDRHRLVVAFREAARVGALASLESLLAGPAQPVSTASRLSRTIARPRRSSSSSMVSAGRNFSTSSNAPDVSITSPRPNAAFEMRPASVRSPSQASPYMRPRPRTTKPCSGWSEAMRSSSSRRSADFAAIASVNAESAQ